MLCELMEYSMYYLWSTVSVRLDARYLLHVDVVCRLRGRAKVERNGVNIVENELLAEFLASFIGILSDLRLNGV